MAKGDVYAYHVDLTNREDIYKVAERVKREVGKVKFPKLYSAITNNIRLNQVSILVNNAGVVTGKNLLDCTDEQIQRTFDVNTLAHFWVNYRFRFTNVTHAAYNCAGEC